MKKEFLTGFAILFCFFSIYAQDRTAIIPVSLACELRDEAMGVDVENPSFGYKIEAGKISRQGMEQSAFRLLVASSQDFKNGGDMWDSKKVTGNQMAYIKYDGKALGSTKKYWWKVMVWGQNGYPSKWSKTASFTTGVLFPSDWKAGWISATGAEKYAQAYQSAHTDFNLKREIGEMRTKMPTAGDANFSSMLLRKDFSSPAKLKSAIIHMAGLGHYELIINSKKVGDQLLAPGWSEYKKRFYTTHMMLHKRLKVVIMRSALYLGTVCTTSNPTR